MSEKQGQSQLKLISGGVRIVEEADKWQSYLLKGYKASYKAEISKKFGNYKRQ